MHFPRRSGSAERAPHAVRLLRALLLGSALVLTPLAATSCRYSPYKFAGGGLPSSIRSIAVLPFENETPVPELQRELYEALRGQLQNRLNLRDAPEARADAIVRGTIVRYDADVPIAFSANPQQVTNARRELQLVVDIAIIEQATGRTLWEKRGLTTRGQYAERNEAQGRRDAVEKVITDVIEGAQSQW